MRTKLELILNALLIIILCGVLIGAYYVQFTLHEEPCPLCLLQRIGMIGVGIGALLNLKFGLRTQHYALSILCAVMGASVSLRHITLHICPGLPQVQLPFLGLHLYTWAFLVFVCSLLALAAGLALHIPSEKRDQVEINAFPILGKIAFYLLLFVAATNALATFIQCGLSICT